MEHERYVIEVEERNDHFWFCVIEDYETGDRISEGNAGPEELGATNPGGRDEAIQQALGGFFEKTRRM